MKQRQSRPLWQFGVFLLLLLGAGIFVRQRGKEQPVDSIATPVQAAPQTASSNATAEIIKFGSFKKPSAIAADSKGQVYVLDAADDPVIKVFTPQGQDVKTVTISTLPDGIPTMLTVASDGTMYAARLRGRHVLRIAPDGKT